MHILEFHFHIYFEGREKEALELWSLIKRKSTFFTAIPLRMNREAVGPHPVPSYEVWVPQESFAAFYSFILQHRGNLTVFIHPLTRNELLDHTDRATFIGKPYELHLARLSVELDHLPLQYPELGLGYSART